MAPPQTHHYHHHHLLRLCFSNRLSSALSLIFSPPNPQTPPPYPHPHIYATLFRACARHNLLPELRHLHHHLLLHQPHLLLHHPHLPNHLLTAYSTLGSLSDALRVFHSLPHPPNLVSWSILVSAYSHHSLPDHCFRAFSAMHSLLSPSLPNEFAISSALSACASHPLRGAQLHALSSKTAHDRVVYVANALISMYSRSRDVRAAWSVFVAMTRRNLVSWNSMIGALRSNGSLSLFETMRQSGVGFDRATLLSVLSSAFSDLRGPRQLHCLAAKAGLASSPEVSTALGTVYSALGADAEDCRRVFADATRLDVVSWTAILASLVERGEPEEALLGLKRLLLQDGLRPDRHVLSITIKACAAFPSDRCASAVHALSVKVGYGDDTVLANALIHAYARCGCLVVSERVFLGMSARDVVSWNAMIKAYAAHGRGEEACDAFSRMDVPPDEDTLVGILAACSHSGLVERGRALFDAMQGTHGIAPQLNHYACVVDMLGRAGRLSEAESLIDRMPMEPDSVIWSALLSACRKHGEPRIGERVSRKLRELEPDNSIGYVMMSNIYCESGSYGGAASVRKGMREFGAKKSEPGLSWIEIGSRLHEFAVGGRQHPQREAIYAELERLVGMLKEKGFAPETGLVLYEAEE
ncbi:Pentatricopeptide repeat-containing protein [Acorus gramineus]|uniref:Pentatricopeptide repeat-containing protein n=1 Tax=Acorus gramineus TaxID=55184 RepID=A0AAV9AFH3_ACOGR|nr:Pentatricopeptide repeat-containing protein [Acorus gramineus]